MMRGCGRANVKKSTEHEKVNFPVNTDCTDDVDHARKCLPSVDLYETELLTGPEKSITASVTLERGQKVLHSQGKLLFLWAHGQQRHREALSSAPLCSADSAAFSSLGRSPWLTHDKETIKETDRKWQQRHCQEWSSIPSKMNSISLKFNVQI